MTLLCKWQIYDSFMTDIWQFCENCGTYIRQEYPNMSSHFALLPMWTCVSALRGLRKTWRCACKTPRTHALALAFTLVSYPAQVRLYFLSVWVSEARRGRLAVWNHGTRWAVNRAITPAGHAMPARCVCSMIYISDHGSHRLWKCHPGKYLRFFFQKYRPFPLSQHAT